jgi:hypothetical protein
MISLVGKVELMKLMLSKFPREEIEASFCVRRCCPADRLAQPLEGLGPGHVLHVFGVRRHF